MAEDYFKAGYNCAQAVFGAYADELGLTLPQAMAMASSLGGGMGRLREVCGAVSAMCLIAGARYGYSRPGDDEIKKAHYARIQELARRFTDAHGSLICRDLLQLPKGSDDPAPSPRTQQYYEDRPCAALVRHAAQILEQYADENR